ncbi:MAG: DUF4383 domain-containing protein [Spartobacteria bacterium]
MNRTSFVSRYAMIIGALLLIEGVWELFSPVVFGILTSNTLHGVIHIVLGIAGLWSGWRGCGRGFAIFLGLLLIVVGICWFVPAGNELVVRFFNLNQAVAVVNLIVGAVSLLVALTSRRAASLETS